MRLPETVEETIVALRELRNKEIVLREERMNAYRAESEARDQSRFMERACDNAERSQSLLQQHLRDLIHRDAVRALDAQRETGQ